MKRFFKIHIELYEICSFLVAMPLIWVVLIPICKSLGLNYQYAQAVEFAASLLILLLLTKFVFGNRSLKIQKFEFKHPVLKYGWLGLVGAIGAFLATGNEIDLHPSFNVFLGYILMNLMIAITEEVVFREVFIGLFLTKKVSGKRLWYAVLFASIIFGLRHMFNLLFYSNQIITCSFQVLSTACAAIYLSGLYLVTGSLIPGIIIHFLEDMCVTFMEMFSSKALEQSMEDIKILEGVGMVLLQVPYVICGVIMIKEYIKRIEKENCA